MCVRIYNVPVCMYYSILRLNCHTYIAFNTLLEWTWTRPYLALDVVLMQITIYIHLFATMSSTCKPTTEIIFPDFKDVDDCMKQLKCVHITICVLRTNAGTSKFFP